MAEQVQAGVASAARELTGLGADAVAVSLGLARMAVTNPLAAAQSAVTIAATAAGETASWLRSAMRPRLPGSGPLIDFFSAAPGDVDIARKLLIGTRNDTTIWTGPVGTRKAVAWSPPLALADVKAVARAHHATVNDVLVTCVGERCTPTSNGTMPAAHPSTG